MVFHPLIRLLSEKLWHKWVIWAKNGSNFVITVDLMRNIFRLQAYHSPQQMDIMVGQNIWWILSILLADSVQIYLHLICVCCKLVLRCWSRENPAKASCKLSLFRHNRHRYLICHRVLVSSTPHRVQQKKNWRTPFMCEQDGLWHSNHEMWIF